jgi:L-seryl-tRNA(Ser) seleniumtransferase
LLLGRKDLIAAAAANNQPTSDTIGRGMKVAKEQMIGMVAAVDWFLKQNDADMEAEFERRANVIVEHLRGIPTVETQIVVPPVANHVPHVIVHYDQLQVKISALDVAEKLRRGAPSIELNPATGRPQGFAGQPKDAITIVVGVWMLQPGEDQIVARRLREVLSEAARA